MKWRLVATGAAVLCALGIAAAVLLVGRHSSGATAPPVATTATTPRPTSSGFAILDTPPTYCIENTEHGKTSVWHWSDDAQKLVKGCPGANLP